MPTQIAKLEAHAGHLLDEFIALKEKYALLDPMLFNDEVTKQRGSNKQYRGFKILRNLIFLSCAQDIAKLSNDSDARTPSIRKLIEYLKDSKIRSKLRELHAGRCRYSIEDEADPEKIAMLREIQRHEQIGRGKEFDDYYEKLNKAWELFSASSELQSFITLRDKVTAHSEVRNVGDQYQLVDIGKLGIRWADLKPTVELMQVMVKLIGYIIRRAGFDWDGLEVQLTEAALGFWNPQQAQ
jgi:AbiU2